MPSALPETPRLSLRRQRSPAAPRSGRIRRLLPSDDVSRARERAPGGLEHLSWLTPEAWDVPRVERSFKLLLESTRTPPSRRVTFALSPTIRTYVAPDAPPGSTPAPAHGPHGRDYEGVVLVPPESYSVRIVAPAESFDLSVSTDDAISTLVALIATRLGRTFTDIRLSLGGRVLGHGRRVSDYDIFRGQALWVTYSLGGGGRTRGPSGASPPPPAASAGAPAASAPPMEIDEADEDAAPPPGPPPGAAAVGTAATAVDGTAAPRAAGLSSPPSSRLRPRPAPPSLAPPTADGGGTTPVTDRHVGGRPRRVEPPPYRGRPPPWWLAPTPDRSHPPP